MSLAADDPIAFQPQPGPQTDFLRCPAFEVLFGGSAGGAKSYSLVAAPLRWVHLKGFYAVTFRRSIPDLAPLIKYSKQFYLGADPEARFVANPYPQWRFGSSAVIRYGHLENTDTWQDYQSQEIHFLGFDEATTFEEIQYRNMVARVRTSDPKIPLRIRASSTPGGIGHDFIFKRWQPWLDPDFDGPFVARFDDRTGTKLPPARTGEILWVRNTPTGGEEYVAPHTDGARTRCFIRSRLEDNVALMTADPGYRDRLLDKTRSGSGI